MKMWGFSFLRFMYSNINTDQNLVFGLVLNNCLSFDVTSMNLC